MSLTRARETASSVKLTVHYRNLFLLFLESLAFYFFYTFICNQTLSIARESNCSFVNFSTAVLLILRIFSFFFRWRLLEGLTNFIVDDSGEILSRPLRKTVTAKHLYFRNGFLMSPGVNVNMVYCFESHLYLKISFFGCGEN